MNNVVDEKKYLIVVDYNKSTGNLILIKDLLEGKRTEYVEEAQKFTLDFCKEMGLQHSLSVAGSKGYFCLEDNTYAKRTKLIFKGDRRNEY